MKNPLRAVSNPIRDELSAAIVDVRRIEDEQNARREILDRASGMVDAALARLEAAKAEAHAARSGKTAALVAAMTSGESVAPDNSTRDARIKMADAEDELAAAITALEIVQQTVDPFDASLWEARTRVRALAGTIMGGQIDHLMHEADEANEAHFRKRLVLHAILSCLDSNSHRDEYERVNSYLSGPIFPLQLNQLAIENHPVIQTWRRAHDALQRDASTELPR